MDQPARRRLLQLAAVPRAADLDRREYDIDRRIGAGYHVDGRRGIFSVVQIDEGGIGAAISLAGVLWVIARGEPSNLLRLHFAVGDLIMLAATLAWSIYTGSTLGARLCRSRLFSPHRSGWVR